MPFDNPVIQRLNSGQLPAQQVISRVELFGWLSPALYAVGEGQQHSFACL